MENTLKAIAVIFIGFYFTAIEASPAHLPKLTSNEHYCHHSLEDQNLPHEWDCSKYYRCVYGKKVPKICPEKMLFNPDIGNCDLFFNVECSTAKIPDDGADTEQNSEEAMEHLTGKSFIRKKNKLFLTTVNEEENSLEENITDFTKPSDTSTTKFVYIPHDRDQTAYYKVENGEKILLYCGKGMVFSLDLEVCVRT